MALPFCAGLFSELPISWPMIGAAVFNNIFFDNKLIPTPVTVLTNPGEDIACCIPSLMRLVGRKWFKVCR
jgi:hypothetical protein